MSNEQNKKFFDAIGMLAAIITVIAYAVLVINAQWPFLGDYPAIYNVLLIVRTYAPLVVVALVALEFVADKGFIVKLICYVAIALVVISMFFPATWTQLVGLVG